MQGKALKPTPQRLLTHLGLLVAYGSIGAIVLLGLVYAHYLAGLPEPQPWHTARLDAEFTRAMAGRVKTLADYRALEDTLFEQVREEVYLRVPEDRRALNRYVAGSRADPRTQADDWNRSFELKPPVPIGGVLLLHGMSDSPYSLRALGQHLYAQGYHVVGLRLPGHGTAPSGLLTLRWEDMAAAVRMAARDLRARVAPELPLNMIGYSNGAALALEYVLARHLGEDQPAVERLIMISPAIGLGATAPFAVWQARASVLLGQPKVAWTDMLPEFDPYKYQSFAVNAGDQVYQLTQVIAERLGRLGQAGLIERLPPILAFQSVADATVSTPALVDSLFRKLANPADHLVLFDVNRYAGAADLFHLPTLQVGSGLLEGPALNFKLTLLVNSSDSSFAIDAVERAPGQVDNLRRASGFEWPRNTFSLSHVALPVPPDDPVYGERRPANPTLIAIGAAELRGEKGLLAFPAEQLIRLRHNPFYAYLEGVIDAFLEVDVRRAAGGDPEAPSSSPPRRPGTESFRLVQTTQ